MLVHLQKNNKTILPIKSIVPLLFNHNNKNVYSHRKVKWVCIVCLNITILFMSSDQPRGWCEFMSLCLSLESCHYLCHSATRHWGMSFPSFGFNGHFTRESQGPFFRAWSCFLSCILLFIHCIVTLVFKICDNLDTDLMSVECAWDDWQRKILLMLELSWFCIVLKWICTK